MKGAWLEDMLSLAPPIAFLVAARVRYKRPNAGFPTGTTVPSRSHTSSRRSRCLSMGTFLVVDSVLKLLSGEHPSIGMVELFDWQVWLGWLMIAALVWSAVPAFVLGRMKTGLAASCTTRCCTRIRG